MDNKKYVLNTLRNMGIAEAAKLQEEAPALTETEIIEREDYIPDFNPDKHQYLNWTKGQCVRDNGQVWKLLQPYDSNTYKDRPENMRAQWGLCHTKNPAKAKPYIAPLGTSGVYMKDECCIAGDGKVYKSKIDNNVWEPTAYPAGWEEVKM